MLKSELHIHINADPHHRKNINYSAFQLIDEAVKQEFKVLAITCHDWVYEDKIAEDYALKKGILLIKGVERTIEGKHVLIYNLSNSEAQKIHTFEELKRFKQNNPKILVIAPHPFHWTPVCLRNKVIQYLDLFDAWEYSWYYTYGINPNRKTMKLAQRYHKPVVGCSDVHRIENLGKTYTLIDAKSYVHSTIKSKSKQLSKLVRREVNSFRCGSLLMLLRNRMLPTGTQHLRTDIKDFEGAIHIPSVEDVFEAIKENKVKVVTKPLSWIRFATIGVYVIKSVLDESFKTNQ